MSRARTPLHRVLARTPLHRVLARTAIPRVLPATLTFLMLLVALPPVQGTPGGDEVPSADCQPTGFTAEAQGVVIHLHWDDVAGATGYTLERAKDNATLAPAILMGAPSNDTVDTQVESGHTYTYRITATVEGNATQPCAAVVVVAGGACAPMTTGWAETDAQGSRVNLQWTAKVIAQSYHVYRAAGDEELTLLAAVDASTQAYTDTTVLAGSEYRYEVRAMVDGKEQPACSGFVANVPPEPPVATTPGTSVPVFPSAFALVVGCVAVVGACALGLRRR